MSKAVAAKKADLLQARARSVVLGTAGHIDHGKTALVLALTGTDTDRLPEEKARGITIDLGFAAMQLLGPPGELLDVSLIDVPGHHAFVRNMLAGAGGMDAVMLVVAADEGVKAQTVEHLQICRLLGLQRGLVVLTKQDAVTPERLVAVRGEVETLVEGSFLEGAPVVAVSALYGQGLGELKAALAVMLRAVPDRSAEQIARLPVDRAFTVRGFGTVVTGTLQAGAVQAGQSLTLEPGGRRVRVRGVQVHGKARGEAHAPNRVALNLPAIEVAEVHRGDMVVPEGLLEPTRVVDVFLDTLPGAPAVRHRGRVRLHAFAAEILATVLLYPAENDTPAAPMARLRLAQPLLLLPGDRFVLRQPSPAVTVGGGRVLDAHPLPRVSMAKAAPWLRRMTDADLGEQALLRVERRGLQGLAMRTLLAETGMTADATRKRLLRPLAEGRLLTGDSGAALLSKAAFAEAETRLLQAMPRDTGGVTRAGLRSSVRLVDWVFALVLERLVAAGKLSVLADAVRLPMSSGAAVGGAPGGMPDPRLVVLEEVYRQAGLASPLASEAGEMLKLAPAELRTLLTTLLRSGKLVRLGSDALLVHRQALERLTAQLQKQHGQSLDVGQFKALTGLTRKHAIPLLEYLDGARVTCHVGGVRRVV